MDVEQGGLLLDGSLGGHERVGGGPKSREGVTDGVGEEVHGGAQRPTSDLGHRHLPTGDDQANGEAVWAGESRIKVHGNAEYRSRTRAIKRALAQGVSSA